MHFCFVDETLWLRKAAESFVDEARALSSDLFERNAFVCEPFALEPASEKGITRGN